jgi:hypothetical protein
MDPRVFRIDLENALVLIEFGANFLHGRRRLPYRMMEGFAKSPGNENVVPSISVVQPGCTSPADATVELSGKSKRN